MGMSVFVDLIKGPKGRGEPEKITSSVDLMKNKLKLKLHSEELLRPAASQSHYLQNTSPPSLTRALCVFSGIWTTCGLPCLRTQLEDTPQLWRVIEQFRMLSVGCSSWRDELRSNCDWKDWKPQRCYHHGEGGGCCGEQWSNVCVFISCVNFLFK